MSESFAFCRFRTFFFNISNILSVFTFCYLTCGQRNPEWDSCGGRFVSAAFCEGNILKFVTSKYIHSVD